MNGVASALQLARDGQGAAAVAQLQTDGSAGALTLLALWQIEGKQVPRDTATARANLKRAADLGSAQAARIHAGLLATGIGGPADWPAAVQALAASADPLMQRQHDLIAAMALDAGGAPLALPEAEPIAPGLRWHRGLLSPAECSLLASLAAPRLKPARIWHEGQRAWVVDPLRQAHQAGFAVVYEWPFVHAINRRIAAATGTDVRRGEPLQVLRYVPGELYAPHLDAVPGLENQRVTTMLIWLNDAFDGGETAFDRLGLSLRGQIGDALEFSNVDHAGRPDAKMRHEGRPVTAGQKLLASRWIRARASEEYGPQELSG
ncbi:MAG TPA: 2OG-Fe(II) oxygenase [Sphingomonas sp.]|nr:2OG-Fe(II) oxygenase [Sphingomonas sp.]